MAPVAPDHPPRRGPLTPFELPGVPGNPGVLLLHGLGCSPYTMRSLGESLSAAGFASYAPLLPGHGESLADFQEVTRADWLEAAEASFRLLKSRYNKVVVIGFSMGGTLALSLAEKHRPYALVLLATPVFFEDWEKRIFPAGRQLTSALPLVFDVANRGARRRRRDGVHKTLPVKAVGEFLQLLDIARQNLALIECPILVAQSRSDHTVPPSNAPYIIEQVASTKRRLLWLKRAYHVLPVDYGCKRLEREICRFLTELQLGSRSGEHSGHAVLS
ncbi:MAG: alpha/beta fold hydrolase [Candidatus Eremiobacteraeota bacterium]|nr:alpha/beta fold hydrolase [Candidatus Eremiobacteraeota bacterium]